MTEDKAGMGGAPKSFLRLVKRHIVAPEHRFAVVVPRELGPLCLHELRELGIAEAEESDAGVEFSGRLNSAYACHLQLRTASRVYCRLEPFRTGTAEELFHKVSRIKWELWLNPGIPLEVEAHVDYSRMSHEGRTSELVLEGIQRAFRSAGLPAPGRVPTGEAGETSAEQRQKILVHLVRNQCRISLDMTGAHLHERGYRREHAGAPLRETLACAILRKAEWTGDMPLVDGMCGSGTFPIEAAMIARRIAPGLQREFLFEKWPSFQKDTWEYLRRKAAESILPEAGAPIWGIDLDPEAIRISVENAKRAGVLADIQFRTMDFFTFAPRDHGLSNGLLVLNPPYGRRLEGGGREFYARLGAHLRRNFNGWRFAVLASSRSEISAMHLSAVRIWNIRHGGLPISVVLGQV